MPPPATAAAEPQPDPAEDPAPPSPSALSRWKSILGFAVGIALLAAAVWAVVSTRHALSAALDAARSAPVWVIALIVLLPGANWLLSASMFLVITRRYGRVGRVEMAALMGSAWLLNMLPMRPGLAGRIAYHKAVNKIPFRDSGRILIWSTTCTAAALGLLLLTAVTGAVGNGESSRALTIAVTASLATLTTTALLIRIAARDAEPRSTADLAARLSAATAVRYCDALVWSLRYWLTFSLIGRPISPAGAVAIAAASMASNLLPVNFGLREWVVGLTAAALPKGFFDAPPAPAAPDAAPTGNGGVLSAATPGLTADLVTRACDLLWSIPIGLISTAWLWKRWKRLAPASPRGRAAPGEPNAK